MVREYVYLIAAQCAFCPYYKTVIKRGANNPDMKPEERARVQEQEQLAAARLCLGSPEILTAGGAEAYYSYTPDDTGKPRIIQAADKTKRKGDKMTTEREAWLALTIEDPLEPELPICDPHHHLRDRPDSRYLLEELLQDIEGGHNIVQTVFVECRSMYRQAGPQEMQPVGETEFVQGIAAQSASGQYGTTRVAAGIVGFADLTLGAAVAPVLEAHIAASRNRFRGIRHICAWDVSPDIRSFVDTPELLLDQKFREGFACLQEYGLSFDACVYHPQLMQVVDLARAFPDTSIILNHIGDPLGIGPYAGKREEVFQEWKRGIAALATCPNVVVKLGGLGMPNRGFGWYERAIPPNSVELAEAMAPYYRWCIEQFGVDRCMFESNFPPDKQSYSYTVLWNAFKRISKDFSPGERGALFYDTAVKVYRLVTNHEG